MTENRNVEDLRIRRTKKLLWDALKPGGYFISDDIGDNLAFRDFCSQIKKEPVIIQSTSQTSRKYIGILVKDELAK